MCLGLGGLQLVGPLHSAVNGPPTQSLGRKEATCATASAASWSACIATSNAITSGYSAFITMHSTATPRWLPSARLCEAAV